MDKTLYQSNAHCEFDNGNYCSKKINVSQEVEGKFDTWTDKGKANTTHGDSWIPVNEASKSSIFSKT